MNSHQSIPDRTLALSYRMMNEWEETPNFDLILAEQRKKDNSEVTDMAAALCRSTFRRRALIDWLIDKTADKRPRGRIYKLLRLAVSQILEDDLSKALVCDTAVRFCRKKFNKFEAGFVNQFLRRLTGSELPEPDLGLGALVLRRVAGIFLRAPASAGRRDDDAGG